MLVQYQIFKLPHTVKVSQRHPTVEDGLKDDFVWEVEREHVGLHKNQFIYFYFRVSQTIIYLADDFQNLADDFLISQMIFRISQTGSQVTSGFFPTLMMKVVKKKIGIK